MGHQSFRWALSKGNDLEYLHVYILMSHMFITLISISSVLPNSSIVFTLGQNLQGSSSAAAVMWQNALNSFLEVEHTLVPRDFSRNTLWRDHNFKYSPYSATESTIFLKKISGEAIFLKFCHLRRRIWGLYLNVIWIILGKNEIWKIYHIFAELGGKIWRWEGYFVQCVEACISV